MYIHDSDSPYLYEPVQPVTGKRKRFRIPEIFSGLFVFLLLMLLFEVLGITFLASLDMVGNAIDEIIVFGVGAVLASMAMKWDLRKVFPLAKPEGLKVLAVLLLWFGANRMMDVIFAFIQVLFPAELYEVTESITESFIELPLFMELITTALVPAVTEEMLHRGFLQYGFRTCKNRWVIFVMIGLYFGFFHLSGVRFPAMCMMGIMLAYLRHETGNMFYPMLFHFINNGFAALSEYFAFAFYSDTYVQMSEVSFDLGTDLYFLGRSILSCAIVPFVLWCGAYLLHYNGTREGKSSVFEDARKPVMKKIVLLIQTALIAGLGGFVMLTGIFLL